MKKILKKKRFYVLLLCLCLFLLIAILVLKKGILDIDNKSYEFIRNNLINDNLTPYVKIFTNLGGALLLAIISIIISLFIKNKKISIAIVINLILVAILNFIIKVIIQRERPLVDYWLVTENGYSFPSGHSAVSMAFYGFLIYLVYKHINSKYRFFLIILLVIIILFIGLSRIYLGVHYLSDVLAGFLFAIIYLMIYIYFYNKIMKKYDIIQKKEKV